MLTIILVHYHSESQKPCQRVGIADRKVFVCPESFLRVFKKVTIKESLNTNIRNNKLKDVSDYLENFWRVWKVSRESGKFLDTLESFQQCEKFPDSLENFQTFLKISGQSWKFRDSQKFPDMCPIVHMACMHFWHIYVAKVIYVISAYFCHENNIRALFRKFLHVLFLRPESLYFLCLCCHYVPQFCMQFTTWRPCRPWWDKQAGNASLFQMQLLGCC